MMRPHHCHFHDNNRWDTSESVNWPQECSQGHRSAALPIEVPQHMASYRNSVQSTDILLKLIMSVQRRRTTLQCCGIALQVCVLLSHSSGTSFSLAVAWTSRQSTVLRHVDTIQRIISSTSTTRIWLVVTASKVQQWSAGCWNITNSIGNPFEAAAMYIKIGPFLSGAQGYIIPWHNCSSAEQSVEIFFKCSPRPHNKVVDILNNAVPILSKAVVMPRKMKENESSKCTNSCQSCSSIAEHFSSAREYDSSAPVHWLLLCVFRIYFFVPFIFLCFYISLPL